MTIHRTTLAALALLALAATPSPAQPMSHAAMPGMAPAGTQADAPSSKAFRSANDTMMKNMDVPLTGDADRDFVASMIPHHQGAIDMARIQLQYGHDPKLHALAQSIVAAQQKEIAEMQEWQAAHPK